jgi:hypothetical protein
MSANVLIGSSQFEAQPGLSHRAIQYHKPRRFEAYSTQLAPPEEKQGSVSGAMVAPRRRLVATRMVGSINKIAADAGNVRDVTLICFTPLGYFLASPLAFT